MGSTTLTNAAQADNKPSISYEITRPTGLNAAFADNVNFEISRTTAGTIRHGFDRAQVCKSPDITVNLTTTIYYVDGTNGVDANTGLSWALAKKSISSAITAGNAQANPYIVYILAGAYYRAGTGTTFGFGLTAPNKACSFIAVGGRVRATVSDTLTWTVHSGTTYKATRSGISKIYDRTKLTALGDYSEIPLATSLENCIATPNTWYTDNVTIYVNRQDLSAVTNSNTVCFFASISGVSCATSGDCYYKGIDFEGGNQYVFRCSANATGSMVFEDCSFKYTATAGSFNGLTVLDVKFVAAIRCVAAQNSADGFNAHASNSINPFLLTIDCIGRDNGKIGATSCNGLTTHDGLSALDINGSYTGSFGGGVAVVNANTQLWCINTRSYNNFGDVSFGGSVPASDFLTDQHATATLFLDGCNGYGSKYSTYNPMGVINEKNCDFESRYTSTVRY